MQEGSLRADVNVSVRKKEKKNLELDVKQSIINKFMEMAITRSKKTGRTY